jgi:hypothetical protein
MQPVQEPDNAPEAFDATLKADTVRNSRIMRDAGVGGS